MKAKTLRNSQAFPNDFEHEESLNIETGLTKREYFAAVAMQGLLASDLNTSVEDFSIRSVEFADALINALNK